MSKIRNLYLVEVDKNNDQIWIPVATRAYRTDLSESRSEALDQIIKILKEYIGTNRFNYFRVIDGYDLSITSTVEVR